MKITASNIGCNIGGVPANILAYADDMVLMAPSWPALQHYSWLRGSVVERRSTLPFLSFFSFAPAEPFVLC